VTWLISTLPLQEIQRVSEIAAFMHRSQIMGAFCRIGGFFEKPAQGDPPRRFSAAEVF